METSEERPALAWHRRLPARYGNEAVVEVFVDGNIRLTVQDLPKEQAGITMTINQAGDLAHALAEAQGHSAAQGG